MLHELSDLLHSSLPEIKSPEKVELGPAIYLVNPPCKRKKIELEKHDDDYDDDAYLEPLPAEEMVTQKEMYLVHSALQKLLEMQNDILHPRQSRPAQGKLDYFSS